MQIIGTRKKIISQGPKIKCNCFFKFARPFSIPPCFRLFLFGISELTTLYINYELYAFIYFVFVEKTIVVKIFCGKKVHYKIFYFAFHFFFSKKKNNLEFYLTLMNHFHNLNIPKQQVSVVEFPIPLHKIND